MMTNTLQQLALYKATPVDYNFLPNNGFKLNFNRIPNVEFFSQSFQIPGLNLGETVVEFRTNTIPYPGEKIRYDLLTVSFIVDEKMKNYLEIYKWIKELSVEVPEDAAAARAAGIKDKCLGGSGSSDSNNNGLYTDSQRASDSWAEMMVLDSNFKPVSTFVFTNIFPLGITALNFTTQSPTINYVTCVADFAYTKYYIKELGV